MGEGAVDVVARYAGGVRGAKTLVRDAMSFVKKRPRSYGTLSHLWPVSQSVFCLESGGGTVECERVAELDTVH